MRRLALLAIVACGPQQSRPFPLRAPFAVDTDMQPVSVPCRADPTPKEPDRQTCAPRPYVSAFLWDQLDNLIFARISRGLAMRRYGEASNINSLDEVPDSSWFTNRAVDPARVADGECTPDDALPATEDVSDGEWVIDHGKDNGSTPGFRIDVKGKGKFMIKADDTDQPERASAASVIGAALYHAIGFNSTCEQVVVIRKQQLRLQPGLVTIDNDGISHPFDDKALDKVLASSTQLGDGRVRMQASKWLPGVTLGPFRYEGTRADDPNDVIPHERRRELRGSRLLAAWINHWDAREQNTMDIWLASDRDHPRSSPGFVEHHILDTSETLGGQVRQKGLTARLGFTYTFDAVDIAEDLVTLGIVERPWDRVRVAPGHERFLYFSAREFVPEHWKAMYANPAFLRMTERDGAWMARKIAQLSPDDVHAIVTAGRFTKPADVEYLTKVLVGRQQRILTRYLGRVSPLGGVHQASDARICATDYARLRGVFPSFTYSIVERPHGAAPITLGAEIAPNGEVCFRPRPVLANRWSQLDDSDPHRIVIFEVRNGTSAGPLEIHAYDLGARGMRVVGVTRPEG